MNTKLFQEMKNVLIISLLLVIGFMNIELWASGALNGPIIFPNAFPGVNKIVVCKDIVMESYTVLSDSILIFQDRKASIVVADGASHIVFTNNIIYYDDIIEATP